MKIMLVTTPIRPRPTNYPPIGSLAIINYLRKNGYDDVDFYNIDANRPAYDDVLAHIQDVKPDVFGISAVVSTAYAYTKQLSLDVKKMLPDTLVVVGGNLAASAEILLEKTGVDMCVIGEGERVFLNVVNRAHETRTAAEFADIPGLFLRDGAGNLINTGYEAPLPAGEISDVDWRDLERSSDIGLFISPVIVDGTCDVHGFKHNSRVYEPHRADKLKATITASKGCVARCTFCHRWDKGIRYIPIDVLMRRVKRLVDDYNVGFIAFGDENFGTDRRWLAEFCREIKKFDILWLVGGMRVNCVSEDSIRMMKDAGCVFIAYGMETGSERMLQIMEKKTGIEHNRNAMKWSVAEGLGSPIQLVLGMPGESPETIAETIAFCQYGQTLNDRQNPNDLSINYAQALPGTPLYEFARGRGLIGRSMEAEEDYLLRISDKDAHDEFTTLNFTDYPALMSQTWRPRITIEVNYAYVRKYGLRHYREVLLRDTNYFRAKPSDSGYYANPRRLVDSQVTSDTINDTRGIYELDEERTAAVPRLSTLLKKGNLGLAMICYPVLFYRLRHFTILMVLIKNLMRGGKGYSWSLVKEYLAFRLGIAHSKSFAFGYRSLRKIVGEKIEPMLGDDDAMKPLRQGR